MEANEFVGFTLPVVNEGPWSYFSNGVISEDGEDGEVETMIIEAEISINVDTMNVKIKNATAKEIFDAVESGKQVLMHVEHEEIGEGYYSLVASYKPLEPETETYTFTFVMGMDEIISLFATEDDYPANFTDD